MYDAVTDSYCYDGKTVLKNIPNLRDQALLSAFEAVMTAQRSDEPLPEGKLDVAHYFSIHRHLFQDVYSWAGENRTVRISKDGSAFCYPEYIMEQMQTLFDDLKLQNYFRRLSADMFAIRMAHFLATLNAVHPFREGNGRTQTTFLLLLANQAQHSVDLEKLAPERFMKAMVASFKNDEVPLVEELQRLLG